MINVIDDELYILAFGKGSSPVGIQAEPRSTCKIQFYTLFTLYCKILASFVTKYYIVYTYIHTYIPYRKVQTEQSLLALHVYLHTYSTVP